MTKDWPERIEREVNHQLGGDATVGDIVDLMLRLGWRPPDCGETAEGAAAWESGHLKAAGKATT